MGKEIYNYQLWSGYLKKGWIERLDWHSYKKLRPITNDKCHAGLRRFLLLPARHLAPNVNLSKNPPNILQFSFKMLINFRVINKVISLILSIFTAYFPFQWKKRLRQSMKLESPSAISAATTPKPSARFFKRQWGFNYIMTKKTIKRASVDVGFIFTCYNLRRLLNIVPYIKDIC